MVKVEAAGLSHRKKVIQTVWINRTKICPGFEKIEINHALMAIHQVREMGARTELLQ